MENDKLPCKTFCFGTQYYRMVPMPEDWEDDIQAIAELGMDTIRYWALWKWAEPVPGKFHLDDLHELVQLADRHGLKVILVLELDKTPAWVKQQVADPYLINLDGAPDNNEWSYVNWDHPTIRKLGERFLVEVARQFRCYDHVIFDVWNEPDKPEDTSRFSRDKFFGWLKEKYRSIDHLVADLRLPHYESWDQVPMPGSTWDTGLYLAYQEFRTWSVAEQVRWAYNIVKTEAPRHSVTVHVHCDEHPFTFRWFGGASEVGWDDWEMKKQVDFYITAVHDFYQGEGIYNRLENIGATIANLETKRTLTGGQYWATGLAGGASKGGWPQITGIRPRENLFSLWTCVAHEARGIVYWQYRYERLLAPEIPGWGLVGFDGSPTLRSEESRLFIQAVRSVESELMSASVNPPRVAIMYSLKSHIMNETQPQLDYILAFEGAAFALWINNIPFDVINERDPIDPYETILLPMAQCLESENLSRLRRWVKSGGTLVTEAATGAFDERGMLNTHIPGGQDHVRFCGYREYDVIFDPVFDIQCEAGPLAGLTERRLIHPAKGLRPMAFYGDGEPALFQKKQGRGRNLYFSSNVFSAIRTQGQGPAQSKTLMHLLGLIPEIRLEGSQVVTTRVLESRRRKFIFIFNNSAQDQAADIAYPFKLKRTQAVFDEECEFKARGHQLQVRLQARTVLVLQCDQ